MARPVKCRKVCLLPKCDSFRPAGSEAKGEEVRLTVDEYETLRLIDYEGMNQEEAASLMAVARTTVQQIYSQARFKLSKMLVEGLPLEIEGGEYELCSSFDCPRKKCYKLDRIRKEKKMSVIAIPVNEAEKTSEVSPVFARAPYFALYDFEKKTLTFLKNTASEAESGAALKAVQLLLDNSISALMSVRLGQNAADVLKECEIGIYKAEYGTLTDNISRYEKGEAAPLEKYHQGYQGL